MTVTYSKWRYTNECPNISQHFAEEIMVKVLILKSMCGTISTQPLMSSSKLTTSQCRQCGQLQAQRESCNDFTKTKYTILGKQ